MAKYESQKIESNAFNKAAYDVLTIRVPKGNRELIDNYVKEKALNDTSGKYTDTKGKASVNQMIKCLIEEEMGQHLIKPDKQKIKEVKDEIKNN